MQSLFSEHWHVVRFLRPSLREGVQALPRRLRGRDWVLLHDPVTQKFLRITPEVWHVLKLMNGKRTLDEIWEGAYSDTPHPQDAISAAAKSNTSSSTPSTISQHELVQLLGQLYANDLLQTQVSPDAEEVFQRFKKQRFAKIKQTFLNPISIKIPLFYPDAWFTNLAGLARVIFSWQVLILWLIIVVPAGVLALQNWNALTNNLSDRVLSASNLALLWFIYPVVKAIHEWAHGMAVKAWGGTVREMGLMFLIFTPVPYVDATASYRFPSKWARAAVAAAGISAELLLGAIAVYVWLMAEPGVVTAIAFNVIIVAGVSTLLVNGNPLMRYDGYFILNDILEIPNLAQRATQYWVYLSDRYLFGATDAKPPLGSDREWFWLVVYGFCSPIYRIMITIGLIWFVAEKYFFIGILMALASAWMSLVMPLWKGWKHVHKGASLSRYRDQAQRRLVYGVAILLLCLVVIPVPFYSIHQAVVWLPDNAAVRADVAGDIKTTEVKADQWVEEGQSILQLENSEIVAQSEVADAEIESLMVRIRKTEVDDQTKADELRRELMAMMVKGDQFKQQVSALAVKAPVVGRWVPAQPNELQGRYVKRGEIIGYVVSGPSSVMRVAITQDDMDLIRSRLHAVQVRLAMQLNHTIDARVSRVTPDGNEQLLSAALGSSGGGAIPVDPAQQEGTKTLQRVFDVELTLKQPVPTVVFGDRSYVRFDLGWAPLGWQWALRLRQLFLARFYV
jgi:putative peptide zinc metalloprotease protein